MDEAAIREVLTKIVPTVDWNGVGRSDSLEEAGLDSLDKASVFLEIETALGIKIPDDDYVDIDSIGGIITYLEQQPSA